MRRVAVAVAVAVVVAVASLLQGCSTPAPLPSPPPADYAQLAANYLPGGLNHVPVQGARISGLRATKGAQPGQWTACIELPAAQSGFYAIFYDNGGIIGFRSAVAIDGCVRNLAYVSLPAAKSPKASKQGKKHK